jgi:DNA repair protein RecO (recombination protein O)
MVKEAIGIVLKSISYSESSLISRIYTKEFGKISVMARGAKKAKGGKAGMLEPMNIVELQINLNESRDLQILREISIKQNLPHIRSNIQKLAIGLVMVEILDKTTQPNDQSEILFRLIKKSLITLDNNSINNLTLLLFYHLQLSKYSGFNPIQNQCYQCNEILIEANFNLQNGYLYCKNCNNNDGIYLSNEHLNLLKLLSTTHINDLQSIDINVKTIQKLEKYLIQFMVFHLQGMHNIKSLNFLNEVAFA